MTHAKKDFDTSEKTVPGLESEFESSDSDTSVGSNDSQDTVIYRPSTDNETSERKSPSSVFFKQRYTKNEGVFGIQSLSRPSATYISVVPSKRHSNDGLVKDIPLTTLPSHRTEFTKRYTRSYKELARNRTRNAPQGFDDEISSCPCRIYKGRGPPCSYEMRSIDAERRNLSSEARGLITWLRERSAPFSPSRKTSPYGSVDTPKDIKELLKEIHEKEDYVDFLLKKGKRFLEDSEDIKLRVDLQNLEFYWKVNLRDPGQGRNYWPKPRSASPPKAADRKLLLRTTVVNDKLPFAYNGGNGWTENQSKPWRSRYLKSVENNKISQQCLAAEVTGYKTQKLDEVDTKLCSSYPEGPKARGRTASGSHFVNTQVEPSYSTQSTYNHFSLPSALYKANHILENSTMEGTMKHSTRSPITSRKGERSPIPLSPIFDISGIRERKLHGSSPELSTPCPDSPPEAKRRRIMDDMVSLSSALSSQVSSRSHSPTLSESTFDDSYVSTPGNSPAATLKEHLKKRYSKYELTIEPDLMDIDIMEACKSRDSDEEDAGVNTKVSLAEFKQQYRELSEWLSQVLQVTKRTMGTLALSEKYLTQSYHEELLKQSPRHELFNDYAKQLLQRGPNMKGEITQRLNHVNSQWEAVEKAVSCKDIWEDKEAILRDLETDIVNLRRWLDDVEQRLFILDKPHKSDEETHRKLLEHQVLQNDIKSHSRNVNAVLKLTERLQDEQTDEDVCDRNRLYLASSAHKLQERWHTVWLQSLEGQCKLENALKTKKIAFPSPQLFTGWAPGLLNFSDNERSSLSGNDSLGFLTRPADIAESPAYPDDSLSLSQISDNHSGKDSAVVSEVDCSKMSSEYSDSDLDMFRKSRLKSEGRDIGYSSGTAESMGHISTESDCEDIRKLIAKVDTLVADNGKVSPTRSHPRVESSCDASSEESDEAGDRYSTASDDGVVERDKMFDSVLGLDYNSDTSLPRNLPRFHDTVRLRHYKHRKDRPWSAIQIPDIGDDFDISSLSRSETAIDRLSYGSDQLSPSQTPRLGGSGSSATFPRVGAKRKLYESSPVQESAIYSSDSDTESATSEDYETAETDVVLSEQEEDGMNSTASFSEAAWDNYHQVYTSLGEDQEEQPLKWPQLEEDLEFDEEFPSLHSSSLVTAAIEKRKSKPRLLTHNSRQGYDSDSDLEDLHCFLEDSAHQLKITDRCLMKRRKDQFRTGIALHTSKYAEIIATCQTNINCLQSVYNHLHVHATEEETEQIKDMLYQWEKLHAFAQERQQQSQSLSQLSHALQSVQACLQSCLMESVPNKFSHIIETETLLANVKRKHEDLMEVKEKIRDLQHRANAFTKEHASINLDVLRGQLRRAEMELELKLERVNHDLPILEHIHSTWSEYLMLCGKLDTTLTNDFSANALAARIQAQESGASLDMEDPTVVLNNLEQMTKRLQTLRGQLLPFVDDQTKDELTTDLADLLDQLSEAQRQYRLFLQAVEHPVEDVMQRTEAQKHMAAVSSKMDQELPSTSSSSSSLSSPTSWLKSRYIKAAAVFMMMGVAYIVDPNLVKKIGEFSITVSPELRYVNGPPPI